MPTDLKADLASIADLDRPDLIERWRALYEREPPASISKQLLSHAVAYKLQEKALGGLKPATQRFLAQFATGDAPPPMPNPSLKPGTRLLREWHGITYEVTILEKGVMFNGKQYGSLSTVARVITGNVWSGPVFFGLKKFKKKTP